MSTHISLERAPWLSSGPPRSPWPLEQGVTPGLQSEAQAQQQRTLSTNCSPLSHHSLLSALSSGKMCRHPVPHGCPWPVLLSWQPFVPCSQASPLMLPSWPCLLFTLLGSGPFLLRKVCPEFTVGPCLLKLLPNCNEISIYSSVFPTRLCPTPSPQWQLLTHLRVRVV